MNYQFIRELANSKIGKIPATNSPRKTCPPSCLLRGKGGCYAEAGYYTRTNWDKRAQAQWSIVNAEMVGGAQ